jgi:hypothetical protein
MFDSMNFVHASSRVPDSVKALFVLLTGFGGLRALGFHCLALLGDLHRLVGVVGALLRPLDQLGLRQLTSLPSTLMVKVFFLAFFLLLGGVIGLLYFGFLALYAFGQLVLRLLAIRCVHCIGQIGKRNSAFDRLAIEAVTSACHWNFLVMKNAAS